MPIIKRHKAKGPFLNYRCLDTGVHIIPLQAMVGQLMYSSGICLRCGQTFSARVGDTQVGSYWADVRNNSMDQDQKGNSDDSHGTRQ